MQSARLFYGCHNCRYDQGILKHDSRSTLIPIFNEEQLNCHERHKKMKMETLKWTDISTDTPHTEAPNQ